MGMNDDLVLGLGLTTTVEHISYNKSSPPSLTLSLFGQTFDDPIKKLDFDYNKVCSNDGGQDSAASSLSNVSVKRERDVGSEEVDTERVSSRVSDEDDDGSNGRKKLRLTKAQSALLEESFKLHSTLNPVSFRFSIAEFARRSLIKNIFTIQYFDRLGRLFRLDFFTEYLFVLATPN